MTSNCFGARTSCMPPASASMCSSVTSGYSRLSTAVTTSFHSTPDFMTFRFSIDVTLFAPGPGEVEGDAGDPLDLVGVVDLRVDAALLAVAEVADLLRLAEIDAAGQLADDEDVEALDQLALQRRGVGERRVDDRRPQIGEELEVLAQPEQPRLGAHVVGNARPISARRPRRRAPRRRRAPSPSSRRRSPCRARRRPSRRRDPLRSRSASRRGR